VPLNLAGTFPHIGVLGDLPADEHGFFLDQYREAVDNVRDPAGTIYDRAVRRRWRP